MIYRIFGVENNVPLDEESFDILMSSALPLKQQEILNQKIKSNADNSIIGIALAKYALIEVFGLHGKLLDFAYTKSGKPYLKNNSNIHFSISHSEHLTVCAVADSPVGIDVEITRKYNQAVSNKIFGNELTNKLNSSRNPDGEFTKLWTEKEAILKISGEGVSGIRKRINYSDYILNTFFHNNYCITVAIQK